MTDLRSRFQSRISKPQGETGCWLWTGCVSSTGYGRAFVGSALAGPLVWNTQRVAYALFVGPVVAGFDVDHLCHNADVTCPGGPTCVHRRCVNPAHLELVTRRVNTLRSPVARSAVNARKTHCVNGHAFTTANTFLYDGYRYCRACRAERMRRWRARAKAIA